MSFRTLRGITFLPIFLLAPACAEGDPDEPGSGGSSPSTTSSSSGDTTATGAGSTSATSGGPPMASWDVQADFTVNGHEVDDAIQSAISRHTSVDGHDFLSVIVTDVPSFCTALGAGDCGTDPHFRLEFAIEGTEPGTYDIADGTVSVWSGDVPQSCVGAGLGADSGTVTFTEIDLEHGV